jgi:hypothetical protein
LVFDSGEAVQQTSKVYATAWAPLTSFAAEPQKGDSVVFDGITYRVAKVEKEPEGGRLLNLADAQTV